MAGHYPKIFVSYGGPDVPRVTPLIARLEAFGFDVVHYKTDMDPGDPIAATVKEWIKDSKATVVCFSKATIKREWLTIEIAWADQVGTKIIPLRLDPDIPVDDIPVLLRGDNSYDLAAGERGALDVAWRLVRKLELGAPQVVPAALFAMNHEQAGEALVEGRMVGTSKIEDYWKELCGVLGMGDPPDLLERLRRRYGERIEDFRPFEGNETVIELVHRRLQQVNELRRSATPQQPPLFLRWLHDDLTGDDQLRTLQALTAWTHGPSLLIVDSLSMWSDDIRRGVDRLNDYTRTSVVWIPPYTQQTGALDAAVDRALVLTLGIATQFIKAEADPMREVTREVSNASSLSRWLVRTLRSIPVEPLPPPTYIEELNKIYEINLTPHSFNTLG